MKSKQSYNPRDTPTVLINPKSVTGIRAFETVIPLAGNSEASHLVKLNDCRGQTLGVIYRNTLLLKAKLYQGPGTKEHPWVGELQFGLPQPLGEGSPRETSVENHRDRCRVEGARGGRRLGSGWEVQKEREPCAVSLNVLPIVGVGGEGGKARGGGRKGGDSWWWCNSIFSFLRRFHRFLQ